MEGRKMERNFRASNDMLSKVDVTVPQQSFVRMTTARDSTS